MSQLDALANAVFTRLEMLSTVPAKRFEATLVTGDKGANDSSKLDDPAGYFRRRYSGCRNDQQRASCIEDAEAEYASLTTGKRRVDSATREGRALIGSDPRTVKVVALAFGVSHQHIRRCRAEVEKHGGQRGDGRRSTLPPCFHRAA